MSKSTVSVITPHIVKETEKAVQVVYAHYENPSEYSLPWIPKSQIKAHDQTMKQMSIPAWLKVKICNEQKRYTATLNMSERLSRTCRFTGLQW